MIGEVHVPGVGHLVVPAPTARAAEELVVERLRQIARGFRAEDDDRFVRGELARGAAARVLWVADALARQAAAALADGFLAEIAEVAQPLTFRQPGLDTAARRLLVEAAALLLAELERLDRAAAAEAAP